MCCDVTVCVTGDSRSRSVSRSPVWCCLVTRPVSLQDSVMPSQEPAVDDKSDDVDLPSEESDGSRAAAPTPRTLSRSSSLPSQGL